LSVDWVESRLGVARFFLVGVDQVSVAKIVLYKISRYKLKRSF